MQKGPGKPTAPKGLIPLGIGGNGTAQPGGDNGDNVTCDRDGYIFVPQSYQSNKSAAFLLALHDAGGNSSQPLELLAAAANKSGGAPLALPLLSGWSPSCGGLRNAREPLCSRCGCRLLLTLGAGSQRRGAHPLLSCSWALLPGWSLCRRMPLWGEVGGMHSWQAPASMALCWLVPAGTIILAPDSRGDTWDLTELQASPHN